MKFETLIKIFNVLASDPLNDYNINQIAKLSDVSVTTAFRILKQMERENKLIKNKKGNNIFYKLNLNNSFTKKYSEMASVKKREDFFKKNPKHFHVVSTIKDKLKDIVEVIVLFGSLVRGEKKPKDIDILLVYEGDVKKIIKTMSEIEYGISVSPLYMTEEEFKKRVNDKVVRDIIRNSVIIHGESKYWFLLSEVLS